MPGTTSSMVIAIMSAPQMGTEGRKGGKEGGNTSERETESTSF